MDLAGLQCGQKDISKSAFQMWQQLFLDKVCMPQPDAYMRTISQVCQGGLVCARGMCCIMELDSTPVYEKVNPSQMTRVHHIRLVQC